VLADVLDDLGHRSRHVVPGRAGCREQPLDLEATPAQIKSGEHRSSVLPALFADGQLARPGAVVQDRCVDDAIELSSLLASLEEISQRISAIVERKGGGEGVDAELVSLERSLSASIRRLRRAARSAERRL